MNKKAIYKFYADCGRMGILEGVLISTKEKVDMLIESEIEVYFGEVLGKHSEVFGKIEKEELTFVSDNEEAVRVLEEHDLTSGFNPFHYTSTNFSLSGKDDEDFENMIVDKIIELLIKSK